MGAWGPGAFDNDTAADFGSELGDCSGLEAKHDLLMATLGAVIEPGYQPVGLERGYELPYEMEQAIAAAAYVADAHTGKRVFSDTVYAKVLDERLTIVPPGEDPADHQQYVDMELPQVSPELLERANRAMAMVIIVTAEKGIEPEWRAVPGEILQALCS